MGILEKCRALFGTTTVEQTKPEQPIIVKPLTKQEQPIQVPQPVQMQVPPQQVQMQMPIQQFQDNTIWNLENPLPQHQMHQQQNQMQGQQCPQHAAGQPCPHHGPAPQQKPMPKPAQNKTLTLKQKKEPAPTRNKAPKQKQTLAPIHNLLQEPATTIQQKVQQKSKEQKGDVNLELRNKIKKTVVGALGLVFGLSFLKNVSSGLVLKSDGAEYRPEDWVKDGQAIITAGTGLCAGTNVCSPTICASTCISTPDWANNGLDVKIVSGDLCVRNASNDGWCDICGNNICGATLVNSPTICGTGGVSSPSVSGTNCVMGGTCICSPLVCAGTLVYSAGDVCAGTLVYSAGDVCAGTLVYSAGDVCAMTTVCGGTNVCAGTLVCSAGDVYATGCVNACQGYFCNDSGACNLYVQGCCQSPAAYIYNCCCDALHVCSDGGYGLMAYSNNYYPICAYSMSGCQAIMGNGVNSCGYQGCDCCVPYDYMGSQYYLCFCGGIFVCQSM